MSSHTATANTRQVPLLVCKCNSCTHWEIGRSFIHCRTCNLTIAATIEVDDHHMLHWASHRRASADPERNVDLLVCKCNSCTHWEIGKDFVLCKTCNLQLPAKVKVDDHDMLHWLEHSR